MKKRSLLALSLVSLVSLVGCGKDGAKGAVKCSADVFDELFAAQLGQSYAYYYLNGADFAYDSVTIKYSISDTNTGYFAELYEDYADKGSFEAIVSGSFGQALAVDESQEYSEEDLERFNIVLADYSPLNVMAIPYFDNTILIMNGYLPSEFFDLEEPDPVEPGEGESYSYKASRTLTTAPSVSFSVQENSVEHYVDEEEGEDGFIKYAKKGYQGYAWADKYGYLTSISYTSSYKMSSKDIESANGSYETKLSFSFEWHLAAEEEPTEGR